MVSREHTFPFHGQPGGWHQPGVLSERSGERLNRLFERVLQAPSFLSQFHLSPEAILIYVSSSQLQSFLSQYKKPNQGLWDRSVGMGALSKPGDQSWTPGWHVRWPEDRPQSCPRPPYVSCGNPTHIHTLNKSIYITKFKENQGTYRGISVGRALT